FINSQDQKADLQWLNSNIAMARTIKIMNKKQSDWDVFQSAIVKAENYVKNPPTIDKQDEVDKEAEDLWQATYQFLNAADRKDIRSTIFWKTSIGVLSDNKPATIKKQLEEKYTLKADKDYTIGDVKDYNGRFGVELTGINGYSKTTVVTFVLEIKNIEYDLFDLANSKQNQFWTAGELQTAVEGKNLDIKNALKVTEVAHDAALQVKRFKITANDQHDYSNYKGDITISQVLNRENQSQTIYIDPTDNTIKSKSDTVPNGVKEIINIGWTGRFVHTMPSTIEKVPNYISPKITHYQNAFRGTTLFNGDISKWDTSNVIDMTAVFSRTKMFNQDISKWDTSKV
ncbi:BspA family leucine-rich repeat surface protein, partial [Williamsoniiplasma luminosum]